MLLKENKEISNNQSGKRKNLENLCVSLPLQGGRGASGGGCGVVRQCGNAGAKTRKE